MDTYSRITSKFVPSSDGALIYAEATGNPSKPAIVFVPGYTLNVQVFNKQFEDPEMKRELYMLRYDSRGHGQSAMPDTEEGYASKLYADDFAAVCKAFGAVKPVFVGWSLAGKKEKNHLLSYIMMTDIQWTTPAAIVTDICAHLGAGVISGAVLLAGASHLGSLVRQVLTPEFQAMVPGLQSLDDTTLYKRKMLEFNDSFFLDPKSVPFGLKCAWLGSSIFQPPIVSRLVISRTQDPEKLYAALRGGLKIMFMYGAHDNVVQGPNTVDAIRDHLRDYRVVEISNAGHAPFYENVKETNEALLAFTRDVSTV